MEQKIQTIAETIMQRLEDTDLGCVYSDTFDINVKDMSAKVEAEFLSTYFINPECEYWLHSTIVDKVIQKVAEENYVDLGVHIYDVGLRNAADGVHVYIQLEITINNDYSAVGDIVLKMCEVYDGLENNTDVVSSVKELRAFYNELSHGKTTHQLEIDLTGNFSNEYEKQVEDSLNNELKAFGAGIEKTCIVYPLDINHLDKFGLDVIINWDKKEEVK